ncbi:unnamed protein product [Euphydryas editha]|uniref:Uncharacterized protein n=1 Tax=Euphydryas editha TaxID=104508 RepID=A0AAU9V813_EUPED|nr:unnamed protein product [Euphydryas editha]
MVNRPTNGIYCEEDVVEVVYDSVFLGGPVRWTGGPSRWLRSDSRRASHTNARSFCARLYAHDAQPPLHASFSSLPHSSDTWNRSRGTSMAISSSLRVSITTRLRVALIRFLLRTFMKFQIPIRAKILISEKKSSTTNSNLTKLYTGHTCRGVTRTSSLLIIETFLSTAKPASSLGSSSKIFQCDPNRVFRLFTSVLLELKKAQLIL